MYAVKHELDIERGLSFCEESAGLPHAMCPPRPRLSCSSPPSFPPPLSYLPQDTGAEEIMLLNNGCLCCTVRGDLVNMLNKLHDKRDKFDHVIIETTG
jgi:hypothetical protein